MGLKSCGIEGLQQVTREHLRRKEVEDGEAERRREE